MRSWTSHRVSDGHRNMKNAMLIWTILVISRICETGAQQDHILDFNALGFVLNWIDTIHVFNVEASLTFAIQLPERISPPEFEFQECEPTSQLGACTHTRLLAQKISHMRQAMVSDLQSHIDMIYAMVDSLEIQTRQRRSDSWVPGWLSHMFSSLTGLAETNDMEALKQAFQKLETLVATQSDTFAVSQNHLAQVMHVQTKRLDSLQHLVEMSKDSINTLKNTIQDFSRVESNMTHLLVKMMDYISDFTRKRVEVESLHSAIQTLFNHHIPVSLVPMQNMQKMLSSLKQFLSTHHPHLSLVHEDIVHYYRQAEFFVIRQNNSLLIHVKAPLSSYEPRFRLYALEKLPLAVPGTPGHYSILAHNVKAIGVSDNHFFEIRDEMDLSSVPRYVNLNRSPIHLMIRNTVTCTTAILDGNLGSIKQLCPYHIVAGPLPRKIVRLSPTKVFVSNITSLIIECDDRTINRTSDLITAQAVINLPCACETIANEYVLPRMVQTCSQNESWEHTNITAYTVNLLYLSHFFPEEDLRHILSDSIFRSPPNISLPPLTINSMEYQAQLAVAEQARFEINEVINATKTDNSMFSSLSHLVLQKMLDYNEQDQSFNFFNFKDWILLILCLTTAFSFVFIIYLRIRIHAISAVVFMVNRPTGASAAEFGDTLSLRYTLPPKITPASLQVSELTEKIAQLIPVDVTLLLILCFIGIIFIVYLLRRFYRSYFPGPITAIYLQIGNMCSSMVIPWGYFVHPANFYTFSVQNLDSQEANLKATPYCFGLHILKVCGVRTTMDHKYLDLSQDIASKQIISYFTAYKIKHFLNKEHFLAFIVKDADGKITSCIKLRSYHSTPHHDISIQPAPPQST
jgi:hypothetical protein